jgi:hypothetical protein
MAKRLIIVAPLVALCAFGARATAQPAVTIRINDNVEGPAILQDFAGLSFETSNLLPDKTGKYLFSGENTELIGLFRAIGIKNLRIGGATADMQEYAVPGPKDIDQLFAFAKAADVKVLYTLRLLNGSPRDNARVAAYVRQHYGPQLVCFQIGNEPDWHSFHNSGGHPRDPKIFETVAGITGSAFPSFLADWRAFASEVNEFSPSAKFAGPDTGSNYPVPGSKNTDFNGRSWTQCFADEEGALGKLLFVTQHDYVGQGAAGVSVPAAIAAMLSRDWVEKRYPLLFDHVLAPVQKQGISYRMTEANDYTGGVDGASNVLASALWALDYLHWHAQHHAVGVNFHNKRWIYTDTVFPDRSGRFQFNPKAYAIRAFEIGSQGVPVPLTITSNEHVNVTAYAVCGRQELYVTLINKEYGAAAREASATISARGISGRAAGMFLRSASGDVAARIGITFGGTAITADGWNGQWTALNPCGGGQTTLRVPPSTAVVVKLPLQ